MTFTSTKSLGAAVTETYTAAQAAAAGIGLGEETVFGDARYRFVKATATIAAGDALQVNTADADEPNAMTPTTAVNQVVAAIARVAIASGSFGWVVVQGKVLVAKLAASTAAAAQLGTSATAGTLSTITIGASPTQAEVQRVLAAASGAGVQAVDAESGGTGEVFIHQ